MRPTKHAWLAALVAIAMGEAAGAAEYELVLEEKKLPVDGKLFDAMTINGSVPGPTLRFKEGEVALITVTNRLREPASIHWHGLLVPARMDGVPNLNGFTAIPPGETFTYQFRLRQSGTYWYHSHSAGQEQMGIYGSIVIAPKERDPVKADRDYVVLLSDATPEHPDRILRNLKVDPGYYNNSKRTLGDFFNDARAQGMGAAIADRLAWGEMRMDPTDLSDVAGYTFLLNGKTPADNWTGLFKPGERVRLRFIDAGAMTIFDVRIPGATMIVVAADGQNIAPLPVDEFRIAPGETYDVVVVPEENRAYTIFAESIDRTGYARGTLAPRDGLSEEIPEMRPRTVLTMEDMGPHGAHQASQHDLGSHASTQDANAQEATSHAGHGAVDHAATHHSAATHDKPRANESNAAPRGWAAGAPADSRVLAYSDLKSATPNEGPGTPVRELTMRLGGSMERYVWTIDEKQHHDAEPIDVRHGERLRITFVNGTMMAHPMHLHGMFFELDNGLGDRNPKKHTVIVPPGQSTSILLMANEFGKWALHCHLLYHMTAGMMTELIVLDADGERPPWH